MDHNVRGSRVGWIADKVTGFLSGEWILRWTQYTANGGTVVAARTLWLTIWLFIPAFLLKTALADNKVWCVDLRQGAADFVDVLPWLGAMFGAVYIAFYTRFSSQWTYLANLYNQIVQAQLALPNDDAERRLDILAAWKAGFIEDAEDLHLAAKPMFIVAIQQWGSDALVAKKFDKNTVGGEIRLKKLMDRLASIRKEAGGA
jgi:hypothetical protein